MSASAPSATPAVDAVIDRMDERLRVLTENRDGRRRFLRMYCIFKRALRQNIADGVFLDPRWAEALCCRMADYYFDANRQYDVDPAACPEPWRHCFDRACSGSTNLLQDMLLGMNAHINYDLPLSTYDTLLQFGDVRESDKAPATDRELRLAFDANLRRRNFDFLQTNQIAWETIPEIQDVMCADFSRLLGLANVASFRYSGRVVEKLICAHRDRAWSHTLLLAMSGTRGEHESLALFISDFAAARAAVVDRLTLNPVRYAGAIRRRRQRAQANDLLRRHVRMLVDHVQRPLTAKAARRALVEYGREAHPVLEEILSENGVTDALCDEILSVLAENPSPSVAATIYRRWTEAPPQEGRAAIRLLASLRLAGVRFDVPQTRLLDALRREALHARTLAESARDLGGGSDDLLHDALGRRLADVTEAMLELLTVLHPNPAGAASVEAAARSLPPSLRREVLPLVASATATTPDPDAASDGRVETISRLRGLVSEGDSWLQACVLDRIGEVRLTELAGLVENHVSSDSDVVRETALRARDELLGPSREEERWPMLSIIEKVLYLQKVELFQGIPTEDLAEVARVAEERTFEPGDVLIREGSAGDELYVIIEGEVDVVAADDRRLARLGRESVIGEMAILSEAPTSATCIATTPGRALRIRRRAFLPFLRDFPEVAIGLINVLSVKLRKTSAQVPSESS